jgi:PIN domain nuclease of toxin-antitoxin system
MTACVIDASAVMAYLNDEEGTTVTEDWLDRGATISTLNVQEVVANFVRRRVDPASAAEMIEALGLDAHPLDLELAIDGGALIAQTRSKGLSHDDRACLSLARKPGLPALTADRVWAEVADAIGVEVIVIR